MTQDEQKQLRADVAAYYQQSTQSAELLPLPAAANRAALNPVQQETIFENWVAHIYDRPSQTWTDEEKAVIRTAATRALRTL
jgi:hypothetical protein